MLQVVHELHRRHHLGVSVHGRDQLPGEEVVQTDVLIGARRGEVRPGLVEFYTDEGALRADRPAVTLLLLAVLQVVDPVNTIHGSII